MPGVLFTIGPRPAVGGLWIAFSRDPHGTNLEITDGHVHCNQVFNPSLAERERLAAEARLRTSNPASTACSFAAART